MKKLLFSLMIAGASAVTFNAQTDKIWSWSANSSTAYSDNTLVDNLAFIPGGGTGFGVVDKSDVNFPENGPELPAYSGSFRLKTGGNSYGNSTPSNFASFTRRYFYFKVEGASKIKIYFRHGSSSGTRTLFVTDGTNVIGSKAITAGATADTQLGSFVVDYTGGASNIYFGGTDNVSIYKIEATNVGVTVLPATMAVNDVKSGVKATAFTSGNRIFISNIESKSTNITVYDTKGSVVKSLKSSADTNFEMNVKGLYIVNLTSEAGEKSVKVLVK